MTRLTSRIAGAGLAAAAVVALGIATADARPGGGGSFGSRGGRTFSAPPTTTTAPRTAAPIERSTTQPGLPSPGYTAPAAGAPRPGLFGRPGFGTGLLGGLLGAGLLGMLFGHGMFGGLGGILSLFGMLLQFALIAGVVMLALRFFRGRSQPAMAGAYARSGSGTGGPAPGGLGSALGGLGGTRGATTPRQPSQPVDAVGIGPADYQAFESRLQAVNAAWDREDTAALRTLCTPEMVAYFGEDLARNQGRGLHDRVRDVKLIQGDLAESWREGPVDYATVAMRFSLVNALIERASGKVVEGDADRPQEVTEIWTFRRERGGDWSLSAIQQA
ncbi:MAG: TIM44-like domain-containing protein [Alsobacter sp.]